MCADGYGVMRRRNFASFDPSPRLNPWGGVPRSQSMSTADVAGPVRGQQLGGRVTGHDVVGLPRVTISSGLTTQPAHDRGFPHQFRPTLIRRIVVWSGGPPGRP
jgi:hypothetical protein